MNSYHDVVVIGAGLQGLAAAHIYTQVEPDVDLLIIDSNDSVGGTWAKENLYPGLRSNNLIGTYEYTDFPMHEGFDVKKDQHIPGEVIHGYFCQYAEKFDLTRRLLLSNKVVTAENVQEGWKLRVVPTRPTESKPPQTITTAKLIVATGLTSSSRPISLPGKDGFQRPLLTFGSFRHKAPALLASPTINHVAVYGGSKAAYDCVYLFANAGKRVSWIISASGYGPTFMAPAYIYLGPFRRWLEKLAATRLFTFFSPCIWGDADGFGYLRNLLHQTSLGRFVVDKFWGQLGSDVVTQTGLDKHPELKKLKPDDGAFWYATGLGILNYPKDIHEFVRNGTVTIIRKDIKTLEKGGKVILADGSEISAEAMVCSTGWNYASGFKFLPETLHAELGIPSTSFCKTQTEIWDTLTAKADAEILERFPRLARQPRIGKKPPAGTQEAPPLSQIRPASEKPDGMTPWRLWRGIAPPVNPEKNLVFLGMMFMLHGRPAVRNQQPVGLRLHERQTLLPPLLPRHLCPFRYPPLTS